MKEVISLNKMFKDHFEVFGDYYPEKAWEEMPDWVENCKHCNTVFTDKKDAIIHFNTECGRELGLKAKSQKNKPVQTKGE